MRAPTPTNAPHEERGSPPVLPASPEMPRPATPPAPIAAPPRRRTTSTALIIAVVAIVILVPVMLCVGAAMFTGFGGLLVSRQAHETATSNFQFAVSDHPTITIFDTAGQVTVTKGATQQVKVVATKHAQAWTSASARDLLKTMTVTAVPVADGARINADIGQNAPFSQRTVDLRITVPQTSDLRVTLRAGTVTIASITGTIHLAADAGTVDLRDVVAQGATTLKVATGTLNMRGALANGSDVTATVATGNANIWLPSTSATHLTASTSVGSIAVTPWAATIQHSGTGQSTALDLNPQPTSTLTAHVDVGSIKITGQ